MTNPVMIIVTNELIKKMKSIRKKTDLGVLDEMRRKTVYVGKKKDINEKLKK